ncbi:RNA polymerase sigma factor [Dactylosporangium sp. CS-047395]|uniref:RNA polymerase sigma factor n=1 Tax=Dactylosporangium sp. CS-047395 TaxID=3239936 RepID=UPI003D927994
MLAATVRVARDLDLAEECVQDAYVSALDAWLRQGVPDNPGAWLTTAAQRRALNAHRRAATLRSKLPLLVVPDSPDSADEPEEITDDRLRLVFTCCHPALAREAQLALTLRLVCGLTTAEIARAFLVSEPTMAARVTRAKKKIAAARIPYRVPAGGELPERLDAVLTVVHLLFTTGHAAPTGAALLRPDLVERALDLARTLGALMPDEREAHGLLALMLLHDARRATRTDAGGRLVLLEAQDRTKWDRSQIEEGLALVRRALTGGRPGRFALQATIAALYTEAPSYAETDWRQLLAVYDLLLAAWPTPVVALNRAVVVAMVHGPAAGLTILDELAADPRLAAYHYLPAARADLLMRLGEPGAAADAYDEAISRCDNAVERGFLEEQLKRTGRTPHSPG